MCDANRIIDLGFPVFCRALSINGTGKNQPGKLPAKTVKELITWGKGREGQGSIMLGGSQKQYVDCMKTEGDRWANVVRETGVKAQ